VADPAAEAVGDGGGGWGRGATHRSFRKGGEGGAAVGGRTAGGKVAAGRGTVVEAGGGEEEGAPPGWIHVGHA
jgi:hypothetical protein